MNDEPVMEMYAPCIRCGGYFGFDPDTVPSTRVHPQTRCNIRPDGTRVVAGDRDGVREPLCRVCAGVFRAAKGADRPLTELFPHARTDRIHTAAALRTKEAS